MNYTYPLSCTSWDEKEITAINRVVQSNFFTMGKEVLACEKLFAETIGSKFCVMTSSGSTANLISIASLFFRKNNFLKKGDEIIVPAVSWSTTFSPLQQYGLKLKFVDIDINTLNFDLTKLQDAITANTKAIFAVNLLGNPNDFAAIQMLISDKNIILIEDNCESMGAVFNNRAAGTFGLLGTFSTFYSHHLSTMEGGFVVTDDEEIYHLLLCLRAHGWTRNLPETNWVTGEKSKNAFDESYRFVLPGYNVRPLEFSGAIGVEQIKKLDYFLKVRRNNAEIFLAEFSQHPYFHVQEEVGKSSWFGFSLIIKKDAPLDRTEVVKKLLATGIETRPIVSGNFTKNKVLEYFDYEISGQLKNADLLDTNGFFVGNYAIPLKESLKLLKSTLIS
ncbi:MAG: DegT/DnrJ/EryC1/StrS family aminotransferase [Pseudobdellovibrio sp.]